MTGVTHQRLVLLKPALDRLYDTFNLELSVQDPVHIVRRYRNVADREVVAFCAAALAFGRVASVLNSIERLLAVMGPRPAAFVRTFDPKRQQTALAGFVHRWTRAEDVMALLLVLRQMLEEAGSIEGFFTAAHNPSAPDVREALETFTRRALDIDVNAAYNGRPHKPGVGYFFPHPSSGGACKRLNLFLRWMVRRDDIDPGGWKRVSPSQLIVPLDTHVIRVGQCLKLTQYRGPGWKMAADITASLRRLDADDPVRYDFSLCHLGMMNTCSFQRPRADSASRALSRSEAEPFDSAQGKSSALECPLREWCQPHGRRRATFRQSSARP